MLVHYGNNWCLDGRIISLGLKTFFQPYQQQGKKIICCISYVEEMINFYYVGDNFKFKIPH
jgi:hypothetical protein